MHMSCDDGQETTEIFNAATSDNNKLKSESNDGIGPQDNTIPRCMLHLFISGSSQKLFVITDHVQKAQEDLHIE